MIEAARPDDNIRDSWHGEARTMGFQLEAEMSDVVSTWLRRQGLATKSEFCFPWGICDLVGVSFRPASIRKRLKLGQRKALGPARRIALYTSMPDELPIRAERLLQNVRSFMDLDGLLKELAVLEAGNFVRRTKRGLFLKVNGWMPLHKRIVTVELKLHKITEVMRQAEANREVADESYVGLPYETAARLVGSPKVREFTESGIGVLGLTSRCCRVLLSPQAGARSPHSVWQQHCVERFWRAHAV